MNEPDHAPDEVRRRRLLYRATHRGTHEADLLVGGFVGPRIGAMSAGELDALEVLLELPDTDLADWLTGRRELPASDELSFRVPPPLGGGGLGGGVHSAPNLGSTPPPNPLPQGEGGLLELLAQMKAAAGA